MLNLEDDNLDDINDIIFSDDECEPPVKEVNCLPSLK